MKILVSQAFIVFSFGRTQPFFGGDGNPNVWILGACANDYLRDILSVSVREAAHSCLFPDGELPAAENKMFSMDALYLWNPFLPGLAES